MTNTKTNYNPVKTILKRELKSHFTTWSSWGIMALFMLAMGFFFYTTFFANKRAELRNFFTILPYMLMFFIPALTMKLFAEENRSGSIETLLTLPVTTAQVVTAKFLTAFITGLIMLLPTVFYLITLLFFGKPDFGPVIGGYLGAVILCAVYASIGLFASSITKNQIVSFFTSFGISALLTLVHLFFMFIPGTVLQVFSFFSIATHFNSIARGIIDSRDLIYFLSLITIFLMMTVVSQEKSRR
ncbi:MAG: ABC transporter permease [Treponema sp.]|nr:ABC transporter permease [Treponema sp.]